MYQLCRKQYIKYNQYRDLDLAQKNKVKIIFQIKSTNKPQMINNAIINDGIMPDDLKVVNVGMMIECLGDAYKSFLTDNHEKLCDSLWEGILIAVNGESNVQEDKPEETTKDSKK